MTKDQEIREIHDSLLNGQRQQMVDQINEYGLYDFWNDFKDLLRTLYVNPGDQYEYFTDATISYFRITGH